MRVETNPVKDHAERVLQEAQEARASLSAAEVKFLGPLGITDPGAHYRNYANMISNRVLSLFDDCSLLLRNERIPAACMLARCILETYAVGDFSAHEVVKAFNSGGLEKASKVVLNYINSSRVKVEEQKRMKEGKFQAKDYHFTAQALSRMKNEAAVSKHILNAMRHMFEREMTVTGAKESRFELVYERLSEWVHPSQTSLFHAFASEAWLVETSFGMVSMWDGARAICADGMHCITALSDLHETMDDVARQLSAAHQASTARR